MPETAVLDPNPVLVAARSQLATIAGRVEELMKAPAEGNRPLNEDEATQLRSLQAESSTLEAQIPVLEADEVRKAEAAKVAAAVSSAPAKVKSVHGDFVITREERTYEDWHKYEPFGNSFCRDLGIITLYGRGQISGGSVGGIDAATQRLARHTSEVVVDAKNDKRLAAIVAEFRQTTPEMRQVATQQLGESRIAPNITAGTGGDLIPPMYEIDKLIGFQRAKRVVANRVTNEPLPAGTSSVTLPRITTPTLTGLQTAPGSQIVSQDFKTKSVTASVQTLAGQTDIDQQLIDFSPLDITQFVFADSGADLDQKTDALVIAGVANLAASTTGLTATSAYLPSYTSTSYVWGVSGNLWTALGNGMANVATTRFLPVTGIWMHPRRWYNAVVLAVDTLGRPLIAPNGNGPFNSVISPDGSNPVNGIVAQHPLGPPIILDANMPVTVNSATDLTTGTQDMTLALKEDDIILYEGAPRMRAMVEPLSGTLQVRYQVWNYLILLPNRFEASVSMLRGAGGATPSW